MVAVLGFIIIRAQTPSINSYCIAVPVTPGLGASVLSGFSGCVRLPTDGWCGEGSQGRDCGFGGRKECLNQMKMDEGLLRFGTSY